MASPSGRPPSEILKKLDDQLTCSICLDRYTDPRTLPCQHACCKRCIDLLLEKREVHVVKCPICRKDTKLGEEGATTLPKAFHINSFLEIDQLLKKIPVSASHPECSKHRKAKSFFCEECEELMCFKCSREYPHHDHLQKIVEADEVYEKHLQQIRDCLQPLDGKIAAVAHFLDNFDTTERKIIDQGEAVKKEIHQAVREHLENLQELIQKSEKVLIDRVETATRHKLQLHSLEKEEFETILVQLQSCKEFVEEKLRSQSKYQIQAAKKELVQCISDAHSEVKVSNLQPGQSADTKYARKSFTLSPPDLGSVKSTCNYQSVHSLFSVDIPQCVLHGVTTEVSVITSLPLSVKLAMVHCKVKNIDYSTEAILCKVKQVSEDHFSVIVKPEQPGPHELSVCIGDGDAHIHGSPFEVPVMSIAEWRGQRLKVFARGLKHPRGLAVTDDGKHVIVTEWQRHCVAVFSAATGELLDRIGQHGNVPGEFIKPYEVEVSGDNHIFVKDEQYIQKFALNGSHKHRIEAFEFSHGMAVLPCGSVLTSTKAPHSTTGSIIKIATVFEDCGDSICPYDFDSAPFDIVIDNNGSIYVLTSKHGIRIFTPQGKFIGSFGSDYLNNPFGFCIDSNNIIYVTDKKEVKMFTTEGQFLGSFGNHPKLRGIGISKTTGDLYICKANGEVLVSPNTQ